MGILPPDILVEYRAQNGSYGVYDLKLRGFCRLISHMEKIKFLSKLLIYIIIMT